MKNLLQMFKVDSNRQQKKFANLKTDYLELLSIKSKKKKKE